jgi:phospholipid/cholesterol/gamma-HCH transport system substrate-binding protein
MVTKSQRIRLGIFVGIAILLLLIMLSMVIGSKFFEKRDFYYIAYKDVSVSGLDIGSAVKYHGIRVGRVEEFKIDPEDITRIIVKISVTKDTPIKSDVEAVISNVGITGLKLVELVGGTPEAETVKPNSYIKSGSSVFEAITGKAEVIAEKLEFVLNNLSDLFRGENKTDLKQLIKNAKNSLANINSILEENRDNINISMSNIGQVSDKLVSLSNDAEKAVNDISAIINSDELRNLLSNISTVSDEVKAAQLKKTIQDINTAVDEFNKTFTHVDLTLIESREDIIKSMELLKETMQYLNEFSRLISEEPSLLIKSRGIEEIPGRK